MPKKIAVSPRQALRRPAIRNSRGSSSGCAALSSTNVHAANSTAAPANPVTTTALPQPASGPWTMPTSNATEAPTSSTAASGSIRRSWRDDTGAIRATSAAPARAAGTAAANSQRHEPPASTSPPPTLPSTPPMPVIDAQVAIVAGLRAAGTACSRTASELGSTAAAPTPVSARPASSTATSGASADTSAPAANSPSPASSTPLRPNRSPAAPPGITRQANTIT